MEKKYSIIEKFRRNTSELSSGIGSKKGCLLNTVKGWKRLYSFIRANY